MKTSQTKEPLMEKLSMCLMFPVKKQERKYKGPDNMRLNVSNQVLSMTR